MPGNGISAGLGSTLSLLYLPELRAAAVSMILKTDPGASSAPVGPLTDWFRLMPGILFRAVILAASASASWVATRVGAYEGLATMARMATVFRLLTTMDPRWPSGIRS